MHKGKSDQYKEKQKIREKREMERQRKTYFKQKKGEITSERLNIAEVDDDDSEVKEEVVTSAAEVYYYDDAEAAGDNSPAMEAESEGNSEANPRYVPANARWSPRPLPPPHILPVAQNIFEVHPFLTVEKKSCLATTEDLVT